MRRTFERAPRHLSAAFTLSAAVVGCASEHRYRYRAPTAPPPPPGAPYGAPGGPPPDPTGPTAVGSALTTFGVLAGGQTSPRQVVQEWMDSPEHCLDIMDPRCTSPRVGYVVRTGSRCGHHWTQSFGV